MTLVLGCALPLKRGCWYWSDGPLKEETVIIEVLCWKENFVSLKSPAQISSKAWNKRDGSAESLVVWWSRHPEGSVAGQGCWAHTHKKAESVANFDLVADLVPTAYSSDQSVLKHSREEEQLSGQHLTPPTQNQQTVYVLPKASFKEITDLPVTISFLEINFWAIKVKAWTSNSVTIFNKNNLPATPRL